MPLAMANVLQLPIVLTTSAQNMPIVTVTPRSIVLAYTQRGAGHYDALTERLPVNEPGSDIQSRNEHAEGSTGTDSTKKGEGSEPGNWHLYSNSININNSGQ